ncbi:aminopeptidase P N-terminal domain-containing protein [candidate division KSB1 bacterium]|nr:aminopeptidase P N-terminal domain-containing protein [candidate division KSB1 bacterium]
MNNRYFCKVLCLVSILFLLSAPSFAQTPDEFQERRQIVLDNMEPNSVFVMRSNPPAGEFEQYRQDNNFYYLTGLNEPNSALIMRARTFRTREGEIVQRTTTLFITPRNPARSDWDPQSLGLEEAKSKLRFDNVLPIGEFQSEYENSLTSRISIFYMDYERSQGLHTPLSDDEDLFKKAREKGGSFEIRSPNNLLYPLRRIKSEIETEYLRMAIDITAEGHKEAMRSIKPGMAEYQLQSIIEHVFAINGSQRVGFNSIVGSGPNSVILHWSDNSRTMEDGDLVVVDIGAEYGMYTADVTRTIPVNGKFTDRQKDVYNIVLAAQQAGMDVLRPGVSWSDVNAAANEVLIEGLQRIGLIKDRSELRNYYFHGLGHNIGLQVHDVGGLGTLEPGMHFSIEPGIYIREEGLGVRIEDDFLITETGYIHTSKNAPRTVEEIEEMMKKKGTDYSRYLIKK